MKKTLEQMAKEEKFENSVKDYLKKNLKLTCFGIGSCNIIKLELGKEILGQITIPRDYSSF